MEYQWISQNTQTSWRPQEMTNDFKSIWAMAAPGLKAWKHRNIFRGTSVVQVGKSSHHPKKTVDQGAKNRAHPAHTKFQCLEKRSSKCRPKGGHMSDHWPLAGWAAAPSPRHQNPAAKSIQKWQCTEIWESPEAMKDPQCHKFINAHHIWRCQTSKLSS